MVPKICSVDGCVRTHKALGYCNPHYKRFHRYGDPNTKRPTRPAEERFWAKVDKGGPDECWLWNAGLTAQGYGGFHPVHGETILAHRYAYQSQVGPIENGDVVDHTCHNGQSCPPGPCIHRLCCNPSHLDATTNADNVNRSHNSNIKKTHCPEGHAYTPENTRLQRKERTTSRICVACTRVHDRRRRARDRNPEINKKAA